MALVLTVPWPDGAALRTYLSVSGQMGEPDLARSDRVANAIAAFVVGHTLHTDVEVDIPADLAEAMVMLGVKYYHRKNSPNGVEGANDFGPIRVTSSDPDVVRFLEPYLTVNLA